VTRAAVLGLLLVTVGCVYYNGMWSAKRLAKDARRFERNGQDAEAKLAWARAAEKAESVVVRHPRSRWADEALVLQGEGRAGSGDCVGAAPILADAMTKIDDVGLRERAQLAAAGCALARGDLAAAGRGATPLLASGDAHRRSRAADLVGRAALARGDLAAAVDLLARSQEPGAAPARVRALIAAGRLEEAEAALQRPPSASGRFPEADWVGVFGELAAAAGPAAASRAVARFVPERRIPSGARARLLLADGDRLQAAGFVDSAQARYAAATALVPDSAEGGRARVRTLQLQANAAARVEDLATSRAALEALQQGGGAGALEARALLQLIARVVAPGESDADRFRAAELARDSLGAPRLAANLYLDFARSHPASLFAPKAIVAALLLAPTEADSLLAALDSVYSASPYTQALHGQASPAFAAAEDSLALALGVSAPPPQVRALGSRTAAPVPGQRGPGLEPVFPTVAVPVPLRPGPTPARPVLRPEDKP
jgi:hypothetical protein